jgi:hypothetical protein
VPTQPAVAASGAVRDLRCAIDMSREVDELIPLGTGNRPVKSEP